MTAHTARRAAELEVSRGGVPDRRYVLGETVVRVGRAHDNELVLEDSTKSVSRYHAEIRPEADGYVLVDLASQNGTWVGTDRVERVVLQPGSEVGIGPYRLSLIDATVDLSERQTVIAGAWSSGASAEVQQPGPTPTTDPHRAHPSRASAVPRPRGGPGARVLWAAGGGAVVIAGILLAVVLIGNRVVTLPPAAECRCGPEAAAQRLGERAARLVSEDNLEEARPAMAAVREWRPTDARAATLLGEIDERLFAALVATPPPGPTEPPPPPVGSGAQGSSTTDASTGLKQARNEKRAAFQKRVREANDAHAVVRTALAREDPRAASEALAALEQLAPAHPGLPELRQDLEQLVAGRDSRATALVREGRELEAAGNLPAARRKLQEANALKPGAADADLQRLTARMGQLGAEQCAKGKASEAFGNNEQAKALYRRALELLPPDHKDRAECESRLRALP